MLLETGQGFRCAHSTNLVSCVSLRPGHGGQNIIAYTYILKVREAAALAGHPLTPESIELYA